MWQVFMIYDGVHARVVESFARGDEDDAYRFRDSLRVPSNMAWVEWNPHARF